MNKILLFFSVLLIVTSCSIYNPQIASVQIPSQKGDFEVSGAASPITGIYLGASYSPAEHFAVQTYFNTGYINYYGEAMLGYYGRLNDNLKISNYVGLGYERYLIRYVSSLFYSVGIHKGSMPVFFDQITLGLERKNFEIGSSLKLGYMSGIIYIKEYYSYKSYIYIDSYINTFYLDNIYYFKYNHNRLGVYFLFGWAYFSNNREQLGYLGITGGVGVSYKINFNKETNKKMIQ